MFYSFGLLVKSGGEYATFWQLAHDELKKVSREDLLDIDIKAKCQALERYLSTEALSAAELKNKMSLYLLADLRYGIVVAHARKTDLVEGDLKAAIASIPPSLLKLQTTQTRSNIGGRTGPSRPKRASSFGIIVFRISLQSERLEETSTTRNKKHTNYN
ncbi:Meiotic recombination protein REC8-like protein [Aphelenchoides besseyi]|nr:Meiotic recombination protein REC8-like protein [Aphelenchoides besseyi]KAI6235356.1 Meiotic recombination protein REC8-like protein [Aphelenchoides besseyi]